MSFFHLLNSTPSLQPPVVFEIGSFPVTNSLMMILLEVVLCIIFVVVLRATLKAIPGRFQSMVEWFYESVASLIDQITRKREITERIFPLIASLFLFIGVSNIIDLIPGLTSITYRGVEVFRSPTTDFNTTFALAVAMMLVVQIQSIRDWGLFGYIGRFIQVKQVVVGFRQGMGPGMTSLINFLIGLLDIVSELAKVVSLSMRLFGNIYAGSILMVILLGAFAYVLPSVWIAMNIFTGLIQALVFGALVAAYYTISLNNDKNT